MSIEGLLHISHLNIIAIYILLIDVKSHDKLRKESTNICANTFLRKYDKNTPVNYNHCFSN